MSVGFDDARQERISDFLVSLAEFYDGIPKDQLKCYAEELCDIYSDSEFRHSYSKISAALEGFQPDQRDSICQNLEQAMQCSKEWLEATPHDSKDKDNEILKKIAKLTDHVNLECLRLGRIDCVAYIGKKATNELTAANGKLKETEEKAEELSGRVSNFHAQSITILGIFAGLVVAFSAVSQFLSASLSNLTNVTAYNIVLFVSISFFFLFNIIFLLMYCISKIAGKNIASNCKWTHCEKCKNCKTPLGRLQKKYPYVFWFDLLGVIFCSWLCYIAA